MSEAEVMELRKQLEKLSLDPKLDETKVLDILDKLSDVPMTLDLLKKSMVGRTVNNIGKAADKNGTVCKVCKSLVGQWKRLVDSDKPKAASQKDGSESDTSTASSKPKAAPSDPKPAPAKASSQAAPSPSPKPAAADAATLQRKPSVPGDVEYPRCGDAVRDSSRKLLAQALAMEADPSGVCMSPTGPEPGKVAADCETAIFDLYKNTETKYKTCVRSRRSNLIQNSKLRRDVLVGAVTPDRLASMTNQEMATSEVLKAIEAAEKEALMDAQQAGPSQARTTMFKCGKCKGNDCFYFQMQTRSADEPMTTFVTCANCNNKWKFC